MKIRLLNLPVELNEPLKEMEGDLPFSLSEEGIPVTIEPNQTGPKITVSNGAVTLGYHKICEFFRALTLLPSRIENDGVYEEFPVQEDLCLMGDCSRNAVYNVATAKLLIRRLALMGFNSLMLYTEDTYEIPEYPYFGYMRGRFTKEELKELDQYGLLFGVELIPCVQVLAHLNAALHWPAFKGIHDVSDILLAGDEKTYQLIECMLKTLRECFHSHRINLGMDEAHLLGAGKYLDQHGYRPRFEIILEHLNRVITLCEKYQWSPMIWSDMFFRIAFHTYYVSSGEIPAEVIEMVPKNLTLIYWDYYNSFPKAEIFKHMVHCHKQFHNPMAFAGGAWKWGGMCPSNYFSLWVNDLQLKHCHDEKVPMVIATAWGDDGAEASIFSILPTLQQYAEYSYTNGENREWVKERFYETFGVSFDDFLLLDTPNLLSDVDEKAHPHNPAKGLLYNDPLGGLLDAYVRGSYANEYTKKQHKLSSLEQGPFGYLFKTSADLCAVLSSKATLSADIRKAYQEKDSERLEQISQQRIPELQGALERYLISCREQWYFENKTYGFDIIEARIGALKERLRSTKHTLEAYLAGEIKTIDQLEQPVLPYNPDNLSSVPSGWRAVASTCIY